VASARELAAAQFSDPEQQLKGIVDFMVGGVAAMLDKRKASQRGRDTHGSIAASD
jgi:hypothetical protein